MLTRCFSIVFLVLGSLQLLAQDANYGIIMPNNQTTRANCSRCLQLFAQKPKEVQFSVSKDENNILWFNISDKRWFEQMFQKSGDGIAVDIVNKKRYDCNDTPPGNNQIRGLLQKPVYADVLRRNLKTYGKGFRVRIGTLPEELKGETLEYNVLFLNNRHLCMYYTVYNLEAYNWKLLDMGVYLDTLTFQKSEKEGEELQKTSYKTLKFRIPFEKNKSEYLAEDIRPVYDSLHLTDFDIKAIEIQAYSSVEGNLERNIELQEQRAASIVKALQGFQEPTIETKVNSAENWVEFLKDIEGTPYESFKTQSKTQIKKELAGPAGEKLEPILKNHRKALITLSLEKKSSYKTLSSEALITEFNTALQNDEVLKAHEIQNLLLGRVRDKILNPDSLKDLQIPQQEQYSDFLNNQAAVRYLVDQAYLLIAYNELKKLEDLDPDNYKIKYNLAALTFVIWKFDVRPVDPNAFLDQIRRLRSYDIKESLIGRMLTNYYIIQSEKYARERNYGKKDGAVRQVLSLLKTVELRDEDYLSIAQYLTYYSDLEQATALIENRANRIDVDEDLLFYYLNLTIIDDELTQTPEYRSIMLNAFNRNKTRYCRLFNASNDGGVTFQLLEDSYLRDSYCENCEGVE